MILETERLILRPWADEDAPALYRYASDPCVGPAAGWPVHTSAEHSLNVIRTVFAGPEETYAVVLKATGEPVGSAGIMTGEHGNEPLPDGEAEIGYWIGVPYWGQGLIPEAVRALLARCFTELGCRAVWCCYFDGNEKSRRVQEKCGFTHHHTDTVDTALGERPTHFTRITKEAWQAQK